MNSLRPRLTYANLISTLALFLAVSGGVALAATHLAKNSVGTKQLKKNAVTSVKVKRGAVGAGKIANGAVGSDKIADGAVGAGKIANGAVGSDKIAANAVGGAQADEASFQGLVKGNGTLTTSTFTAPALAGLLPQALLLADIPSLGAQVKMVFCGDFNVSNKDEMRVQVVGANATAPYTGVMEVQASDLPIGANAPDFTEFAGGSYLTGGEILRAHLSGSELPLPQTEIPGLFGIVAKWDVQLFRGSGPNASSAHITISARNDSTANNQQGQCHISAETIVTP